MAAPSAEDFAALQLLLKASSKEDVKKLCNDCFSSTAVGSDRLIENTSSSLSATPEEASQLICSLHKLTRHVLFRGLTAAEDILGLFPENFHQSLKKLLTKIILENLAAWRSEAEISQISLPRLVDMDWRVDIKTASDSVSRMAVPTCLLHIKIREDASPCGDEPETSVVTVELSKETLDTMLDGLGRICDQLSAIATK
uniref:TNF receptor-associated factor 6 isoform X3 n=1 Tax=Geotrypetes seraphini TaxID=260995 RepID=A0A6P8Q9G0_GEOSA|nr:TNF receptor-associated factor 6 isoform X3 [Geotrypetes seraphini]